MTAPEGRKWTLRARLVAALLVLATVALAVFGVASVLLIRKSQLDRVDAQLTDLAGALNRPGLFRRLQSGGPGPRDLPTDYRVMLFTSAGSRINTFGQPDDEAGGPSLPTVDVSTVDIRGPFTVRDEAGGAAWRVKVVHAQDGIAAIAVSLDTVEATTRQLIVIEFAVGSLLLVVLGSVAFAVVRLGLRPLTEIEHTAAEIAEGDLDRRVEADAHTETGRLGRALNTMIGRLGSAMRQRERSEVRLRRFVADASHELRTPLTSIRGFAELYRRGGAPDRSEVDRLMGRIEEEAVRMGLLVDDLLLLARLDEQRALELDEVDLVVLAADAVHDVSARDPARPVRLETPDGPVRVIGDEHRLRQVTMNLVTNAVTHTPPGTPVTVTVATASLNGTNGKKPAATAGAPLEGLTEAAVLEVRDRGEGIPFDAAPLVFDRFYRLDSGRSRRSGGTGLGLAITAAILEAHNGRIDLHTTPGAGATFRVLLPLAKIG
jgi:two-component system OmpR family sensor kinase